MNEFPVLILMETDRSSQCFCSLKTRINHSGVTLVWLSSPVD